MGARSTSMPSTSEHIEAMDAASAQRLGRDLTAWCQSEEGLRLLLIYWHYMEDRWDVPKVHPEWWHLGGCWQLACGLRLWAREGEIWVARKCTYNWHHAFWGYRDRYFDDRGLHTLDWLKGQYCSSTPGPVSPAFRRRIVLDECRAVGAVTQAIARSLNAHMGTFDSYIAAARSVAA